MAVVGSDVHDPAHDRRRGVDEPACGVGPQWRADLGGAGATFDPRRVERVETAVAPTNEHGVVRNRGRRVAGSRGADRALPEGRALLRRTRAAGRPGCVEGIEVPVLGSDEDGAIRHGRRRVDLAAGHRGPLLAECPDVAHRDRRVV